MLFGRKKRFRIWPYVLAVLIGFVALFGFVAYRFVKNLSPEELVNNEFIQDYIAREVGEEYASLVKQLPVLLGYGEPKTYLILFLNNTELRPGGGFIGSYATVRVDQGQVSVLAIEGTERLDARAPTSFHVAPPDILKRELKVDRWYFRDSNWSPDFAKSTEQALSFYASEGGVGAAEIDAVFAITPTVLEELLRLTGPVEISGITFDAETATEVLEYEVEFGYKERGISFEDRKQILGPFFFALLGQIREKAFDDIGSYTEVFERLGHEKHIMLYATDPAIKNVAKLFDLEGVVKETNGDYLMWVDANLAALKTDHVMERTLIYTMHEREDGNIVGQATMSYVHNGDFDWRTTRYRTYARLYVPQGAVLESVVYEGSPIPLERVDQGNEFGKRWFGTFVVIEPGKIGQLSYTYQLPAQVQEQIREGVYTLFVQKQGGLPRYRLTMDLKFGTNVADATPPEMQENWGDTSYQFVGDIREDREFNITLSP